jgi:hypothetical protein
MRLYLNQLHLLFLQIACKWKSNQIIEAANSDKVLLGLIIKNVFNCSW